MIIIAENKNKLENIDLSKYEFETVESTVMDGVQIEVTEAEIDEEEDYDMEDSDNEDFYYNDIDSDSDIEEVDDIVYRS